MPRGSNSPGECLPWVMKAQTYSDMHKHAKQNTEHKSKMYKFVVTGVRGLSLRAVFELCVFCVCVFRLSLFFPAQQPLDVPLDIALFLELLFLVLFLSANEADLKLDARSFSIDMKRDHCQSLSLFAAY
jgi:hypothetical protein